MNLSKDQISLIIKVAVAVVVILAVLGFAINLVQQLILPLAVLGIGAFAFYKFVLEGRDKPAAMQDEVAESSSAPQVVESTAEPVQTIEEPEQESAKERLSKVEAAQKEFLEKQTPAEEILDQIKARKQRLQGDEN